MLYNLSQLLKEPTGSTRTFNLDEALTGLEWGVERMQGRIGMLRTHQGILITANLDIQRNLVCSRCLCDFVLPTMLDVEEESFPTLDIHTGRQLSSPDELEGVLCIDSNHNLDLTDVLRQYVVTSRPMKPVCKADCAGLCQNCGANLNEGTCSCNDYPSDARWSDLADMMPPKNG